MEFEEIKLLKQSDKSTVLLVREQNGERLFVKKRLKGRHYVYSELLSCPHPYLPKLYEVDLSDDFTTITEEYIEGQPLQSAQLSERQVLVAVKELCSVLEFLHGRDIIHRDIKASNIILAADGHIRLIDFDAARMPKEDLEQDTKLLGTRGYAPPEQYGFAQTDSRADIYSLGVTLEQLLGEKAHKPRYRGVIGKCTNLNPDRRYQSARQVKRALYHRELTVLYSAVAVALVAVIWCSLPAPKPVRQEEALLSGELPASVQAQAPVALPAPGSPHWNDDTGVALWGNVPDSGVGGEVAYKWRLYRRDTKTPPALDEPADMEGGMRGNGGRDNNFPTYETNLAHALGKNGFYYFAVSAVGDGVSFLDSPYVVSDAFEYTGEAAPPLPAPTGLHWKVMNGLQSREHYAAWSNLDDYEDTDTFNVCVYNKAGEMIVNNKWTKKFINSVGQGGIWFAAEVFADLNDSYRFTVQAESSRPNEYQSSPMPDPVPEEYYSPWYTAPQAN